MKCSEFLRFPRLELQVEVHQHEGNKECPLTIFENKIQILLPLFGILVRAQQCSSGVKDLTMTPGSTGEDVARATYGKVWAEISTWDPKYVDRDFFVRFAYAESNYGNTSML